MANNDDLQRFIEELRARISIVDVVGAKVKLVKKGREYQGLCPFHHEKTPSFTVNESKGFYHCFGCGAHGDIVKFEMEANGLPFMEAIQKLAHQAGLPMPQFTAKDRQAGEERKSLYEIMEQACKFFEKSLHMPEGRQGLQYFTEKRCMSQETLQKFRLGYAPLNNGLMAFLKSQNVSEKDMKDLGLIAIPEDPHRSAHDFFRNRVMIPITNKQGKIIAFGGRVMEKIEPKYLNSPETPIFNKRRNLYNLDKAREAGYKEKNLIICEGYMDVMALDSFGFEYAVAPLGTALTEEQIMEAWKVCPEPILCLDGDSPGVKAAMRAVDRVLPILKAGYSLKFMFLPDNMDPDEFLRNKGANAFRDLMHHAEPLINILWKKYTEDEDSSTPERKALIEKTLLAEVTHITDSTVRSYYARDIRTRIYKTYQQTPWQSTPRPHPQYSKPAYIAPQPPINVATPPSYLDDVPAPMSEPPAYINEPLPYIDKVARPQSKPTTYSPKKWTNNNNNWQRNNKRPLLNHNLNGSPEELCKSAENELDGNIRLIIASELIYPDLINEFEEKVYVDNIKNNEIKKLYNKILDIYQSAEEPPSANDLREAIKNSEVAKAYNELWELDMIEKQEPFINDLRKQINKALLDEKLRNLNEEYKKCSAEVSLHFTEEGYLHMQALKNDINTIIQEADVEE